MESQRKQAEAVRQQIGERVPRVGHERGRAGHQAGAQLEHSKDNIHNGTDDGDPLR